MKNDRQREFVGSADPRWVTVVTTDDDGTVTKRQAARVPLREVYTRDDTIAVSTQA